MDKLALPILFLIFLWNPFAGTLLLVFLGMLTSVQKKDFSFFIFIFITAYACLLQSSAIWQPNLPTDWYSPGYWDLYKEVPGVSFCDYVLRSDKEPGWRILNYFGYFLTGGEYYYFINGIVIFTIIITCMSAYKYWKKSKSEPITLIASLALIVWFSEYIGNLINISRHMFAMSLITYAYVRKLTENKVAWWALIAACSVHTLAIPFAAIMFAKPLYLVIKRKEMIKIILIVALVAFAVSKVTVLKNAFSGVDSLSYGFSRLESATDPNDQNFLNSTSIYATAFILVCACVFVNYFNVFESFLIFYANVLALMMLVCVMIVNVMPEVMGRIFVSRFYFLPFVLPYLFMKKNRVLHMAYCFCIVFFFCFRYFASFDDLRGGGFFPPFADLAGRTIFQYFY